jgi:D-hydroxyproline dehydrogenase subunit beta
MTSTSFDVIVIGGGLAGCALTYHLSRRSARVLLLESGNLCSGTSAACAGRVQVIESETEDYLRLVLAGFDRLRNLHQELECELDWEQPGHIILLRNAHEIPEYEERTARMHRQGATAEMLTPERLHQIEPNINIDGIIAASMSLEGRINPFKVCLGFARTARRLGAVIRPNCRVTAIKESAGSVTVTTITGEQFTAPVCVTTAGAWSGQVFALADRNFPMRSTHAEAFITEPVPVLMNHHVGLSGFYDAVHGSGRAVAFGVAQQPHGGLLASNAVQPSATPHRSSTAWGLPATAAALLNMLPAARNIHIVRTWAAPSPFMPDHVPAIGWMAGSSSLYAAAGFHLALPTIPLVTEWAAADILGNPCVELEHYSPARFDN